MTITRERNFSIVMIIALVLSMILPQVAMAYTVKGDVENPSLTIHKFEQEPGAEPGEDGTGLPGQNAEGEPVEGVTYELTQTHKYNAETDEWEEFIGVPFEKVTGANGQVVFDSSDIELGRYEVRETDGPAHVILNTTVFSVDIPMTSADGTTLNYDVHIYPKNEIVRGDAELIKKSEDGTVLPGVKFGLYDENEELIEELTTNAEGKINVEDLAAGNYYFQEIETVEGHALNTTKVLFEVKKDAAGEVVEVVWTNTDINTGNEVTNYKKPEITKDVEDSTHHSVDRDAEYKYNIGLTVPGDIENYSALGAWDTLDNRLSFVSDGTIEDGWDVTGTTKDNIEFTKDGQTLNWNVIDLTKLTPGTDVKITFTAKINPDAELAEGETGIPNSAEIEFDNDNGQSNDPNDDPEEPPTPPVTVDPTEGGLKVIKVDAKDQSRLEGAEFKLTTDAEGNNVVDASGTIIKVNGKEFTGKLENLVTGDGTEGTVLGEILIEGLTPGTYYLHETKAPTYIDDDGKTQSYRLLTKPLEVEVTDGSEQVDEVTVENSKSGWDLPTTGGIGTILFTAIGLVFMGLALFLLFRRKRNVEA